jgi:hypothetical protein
MSISNTEATRRTIRGLHVWLELTGHISPSGYVWQVAIEMNSQFRFEFVLKSLTLFWLMAERPEARSKRSGQYESNQTSFFRLHAWLLAGQ